MPDLLEDIEYVKKSRTAVKGQITNAVNKLKVLFGEVDLKVKNINNIKVQDLFRNYRGTSSSLSSFMIAPLP